MAIEDCASLVALRERRSYANYLFADDDLQANMFSRSLKIAFLRNYTIEMLLPVIRGELALSGTYADVYLSDFDVVLQEALQPESPLYQFQPDVICVMLDYRMLSPQLALMPSKLTASELESEKKRVLDYYEALLNALRRNGSAAIVLHNLFADGIPCMGVLDAQRQESEVQILAELNRSIFELCLRYTDVYLLDLHTLIYSLGWKQVFDPRAWYVSKNPFSKAALVELGQEYGKLFQVMTGRIRKCIVLDCDNTLWGGIVGEVGCHGVILGQDYPGNCYQALQREILHLYNRGILVALCSKNNEEDVLEVFRDNREMLLSLEHVAAYQINWNPKAENIRAIAKKLNIGLDSLVFVDDSEFECDSVRAQLPEVEIVHLHGDPSSYAGLLRSCGLFNALSYTQDDKMRNQNYKAEEERTRLKEAAVSMEDYLRSLQMEAHILINSMPTVPRIAQMTQKTNQFNLTTRRYTEAHIRQFMESTDSDVIAIAVKDKISDLGIIGVMIMKYEQTVAEVDTLLLSCRALGRHIEEVLFAQGVEQARRKGCTSIVGKYLPTKKNMQVADLYPRLGLKDQLELENGTRIWQDKLPMVSLPDYINRVVEGV